MTAGDALRTVLSKLGQVKKSGAGYTACCPAHDDGTASLSVSQGRDQPVVLHCHAGCQPDDILVRLGLTWAELSNPQANGANPAVVAEYEYRDEQGRLLYVVERKHPKTFRCKRPDGAGDWVHKNAMTGVRRVLYRLPDVAAAVADGRMVWLVEGEKDADRLASMGLAATCNPGGASKAGAATKWRPEYTETLRGAVVTIVQDRDDAGRAHAATVAAALRAAGCDVTVQEPATGKDVSDHLDAGRDLIELVDLDEPANAATERPAAPATVELRAFLAQDEPEYDWLIPGLLERGDRLVLTGQEGKGKSTLLRQIGVQVAAGLHPFTLAKIDPLRVLYLDLENPQRLVRRAFRTLAAAAGDAYQADPGLHVRVRPDGLDLLSGDDGPWLLQLVGGAAPDLLITGPLYKLAGGDPTEERTAKAVTAWLDRIRRDVGCALALEAHSPYGSNGGKRPERPYGASLWSRWPEFGLYLSPEGHLRHWRGARDERDWPVALRRGGPWPWSPVTRDRDVLWARIVELCAEAGDQRSMRDLAEATGSSKGAVERAINEHRADWDALANDLFSGGGTP